MDFSSAELNHILVPVDGSKQALDAVKRAVYIASLNQAEVTLLCVVDLNKEVASFEQVSLSGYVPAEIKEGAYKLLLELLHEIPVEVKTADKVLVSDPAETIVEEAESGSYDLVVMGSRGFSPLKGLLMGSVSQYVLQHVHCPVLVVR
jgi:nucleotide-binding universal stress UspA family protein